VLDAERPQMARDDFLLVAVEDQLAAELRDALREDRRRRAEQRQGLFELTPLANERLPLPRAVGVMAGLSLVRHEVREVRRRKRQIGVDRDATTEPAETVIEAAPALSGYELDFDLLAVGQPDQIRGAFAQLCGDRLERCEERVLRNRRRLEPPCETLDDVARPRQRLVEQVVRTLETAPRRTSAAGSRT
jgi:hypothetical protein